MEIKLNEIFEDDNSLIKCVLDNLKKSEDNLNCVDCVYENYLKFKDCCKCECQKEYREDGNDIIFIFKLL